MKKNFCTLLFLFFVSVAVCFADTEEKEKPEWIREVMSGQIMKDASWQPTSGWIKEVTANQIVEEESEPTSERIEDASKLTREDTSGWTKADTFWQVSYSLLHIADWTQTRYVARHPKKFYEANPILGKHPSVGKVNLYFGATLVGHTAISYILPKPYRRYWQFFWIGVEAGCVTYNVSGGVKFDF